MIYRRVGPRALSFGNSLVVQWLGHCAFTARSRFCRLCGVPKNKIEFLALIGEFILLPVGKVLPHLTPKQSAVGLQENYSQRLGVPQDGETRFLIPGLTLAGHPSMRSALERQWVEHYLSLLGESSEGEGFPVSGRWDLVSRSPEAETFLETFGKNKKGLVEYDWEGNVRGHPYPSSCGSWRAQKWTIMSKTTSSIRPAALSRVSFETTSCIRPAASPVHPL